MSDAGEQQQLPVSPAFDDLLVDAGSRFLYPVLLFMLFVLGYIKVYL